MHYDQLDRTGLIEGEHHKREYKVDIPADHGKFLKTAVAFANGDGGEIVFGVRDQTWEIVGFDEQEAHSRRDTILNSIYDACFPSIRPRCQILEHNGRYVIVVTIPRGSRKPYYIEKQGMMGGTYVRNGSQTRQASFETVQELLLEGSNISYDQIEQPEVVLTEADVNAICARLTAHAVRSDPRMDESEGSREITLRHLMGFKLLYRAERANEYHPSNGLLLLDGQLDRHPYAFIQCAVFQGNDRGVFLDRRDIRGPIDLQVEDATSYVIQHLNVGSRIEGPQRQDFCELPAASVREMIANAVAHRSYVQKACVQVALYDDRLEVTSPGRLDPALTVEEIKAGSPRVRSDGLAGVFQRLHLIEGWGTGVPRIYREARAYGLREPKFTVGESNFRVEMFRRPFDTDFYGVLDPSQRGARERQSDDQINATQEKEQADIAAHQTPKPEREELSEMQQQLLSALRGSADAPRTYREIASRLNWSDRKVRYHMKRLAELGLVRRVGTPRDVAWQLVPLRQ